MLPTTHLKQLWKFKKIMSLNWFSILCLQKIQKLIQYSKTKIIIHTVCWGHFFIWLWQKDICKSDLIWRWFWNSGIGTFWWNAHNVLMPLGWGEGTGFFLSRVACHEWKEKIIPKRVTKGHLDSPRVTSGEATSDEWGIKMGLEWRVWELFLWLLLSLKALSFL